MISIHVDISFLDLDLRSRSQVKVKGHRRGSVCVLWMLLFMSVLIKKITPQKNHVCRFENEYAKKGKGQNSIFLFLSIKDSPAVIFDRRDDWYIFIFFATMVSTSIQIKWNVQDIRSIFRWNNWDIVNESRLMSSFIICYENTEQEDNGHCFS